MAAAASALTNLQDHLPACQRCRRLHRRCDTQLPACRRCKTANQDCTFIDPASGKVVRRWYVQELFMRLTRLDEAGHGHSGGQACNHLPLTRTIGGTQWDQDHRPQYHSHAGADERPQSFHADSITEAHVFSAIIPSGHAVAGEVRFWGASSVVALVVEVFHSASVAGFLDAGNHLSHSENVENTLEIPWQIDNPTTARLTSVETARVHSLIDQYLSSTNTVYCIVDPTDAKIWLSDYVKLLNSPDFDAANLNAKQSWLYFCINMMCAIACAAKSLNHTLHTAESLRYYKSAILYIEDTTSSISFPSLQALVLLIVFCLFQPVEGDIWKLLDHACHLAIELCYHRETNQPLPGQGYSASSESPMPPLPLRRTFFWSLYAIEVTASQLCGRYSALTEFVISTQYPDASLSQPDHGGVIDPQASETTPPLELASHSLRLAGCHSRLMTIRSQIFCAIYSPENESPDTPIHQVLQGQYDRLLAWHQEYTALVSHDINETVLSLACEIGYNVTVCSIFQVYIMRLLRKAQEKLTDRLHQDPAEHSSTTLFLGKSYESAISLVRAYERILDSTEDCTRRSYPVTSIDANYMFMAAAVLIANTLLALGGHSNTPNSSGWTYKNTTASGGEDWNAFIEMSVSCPRLLTWCTDRWPLMKGMLKPYKNLFVGLLKELIAKGFIS